MDNRLEDYVDVAERIAEFHRRHPNGSLQRAGPWRLETIGEQTFVVYEAIAYRDPHDTRPGHGTAWEPFPGRTPFTRDSELMNAETAAWGRALVAIGILASRKIATAQDIQARSGNGSDAPAKYGQPPKTKPDPRAGASDAQRKRIHVLLKEIGMTRDELQAIVGGWGIELGEGWMDRLTAGREGTASVLIETLKERRERQTT